MNGTPSSKTLRKAYEKSLRLKLNQEFSKKEDFRRAYRADDSNPVIRLEILIKSSPLERVARGSPISLSRLYMKSGANGFRFFGRQSSGFRLS
jgi:hypothetical protein